MADKLRNRTPGVVAQGNDRARCGLPPYRQRGVAFRGSSLALPEERDVAPLDVPGDEDEAFELVTLWPDTILARAIPSRPGLDQAQASSEAMASRIWSTISRQATLPFSSLACVAFQRVPEAGTKSSGTGTTSYQGWRFAASSTAEDSRWQPRRKPR